MVKQKSAGKSYCVTGIPDDIFKKAKQLAKATDGMTLKSWILKLIREAVETKKA